MSSTPTPCCTRYVPGFQPVVPLWPQSIIRRVLLSAVSREHAPCSTSKICSLIVTTHSRCLRGLGIEVLHQERLKIIAKAARQQAFAVFGNGAEYVLCHLLICLHRHAIGVSIGIIDTGADEHGIGIDEKQRFRVTSAPRSV